MGMGFWTSRPAVNVNTFNVSVLNPVGIWLTWDGWPVTSEDFDLYVVHMPSGMTVASSTNTQDGRQPPTEYVFFVPPFPGTYGIVVKAASITQPLRLEIFCTTNVRLSYAVAESSIVAPADSPFSLSVGAVAASQWPSGPQEPYSSRGPTNKSRLNPLSLTKPDLMGPDRVDTWTYGAEGFPGTSASAPHVAGAAALVWSAHPAWNAEQVRVWLEYAALDLGEKGKDNVYGAGLLRLPPPAVPSPGKSHTYGARAGWYLVSVPTSGDTAGIFGVTLYGWNGVSYTVLTGAAPLEPTKGYWAKLPANATVTASGTVPTTDQTVPLVKGWNLISVPWPYPKAEILVIKGAEQKSWAEAVALGWVREAIWGYDGVYTSVSSLDPWSGYWLYARVEGLSLRLRAGTPPSPPTEASGSCPRRRSAASAWRGAAGWVAGYRGSQPDNGRPERGLPGPGAACGAGHGNPRAGLRSFGEARVGGKCERSRACLAHRGSLRAAFSERGVLIPGGGMGGRGVAPILGAEACDLSVRQVKGPDLLDNMRALKKLGNLKEG
jgi:hypothetical protein